MNMIGLGLYTFQEASRLTLIPARDLRRWLVGYSYKAEGSDERVNSPPLWQGELVDTDLTAVSFHDLLELRFVNAFRKHGVGLRTIRRASEVARELFKHPYPFTCKRFQTDGKTIFATAMEDTGETELLDLVKRQYAFTQVIEPSLYRGIEFDDSDLAARWYPMPRSRAVVLDPQRSFGKPIVNDGAVRTAVLYDAFKAERSKQVVSRLYEVPVSAVDAAIAFEERLAA